LLYKPVKDVSEIYWDSERPVMSIKEAFFPPTEPLISIKKNGKGISLLENIPDTHQIIFGVRPCDARSLLALDALFIDAAPSDPYYKVRRENTIIIGQACTEMGESCFCTSVGGAPDDTTGMDMILYPLENGYHLRKLTDKADQIAGEIELFDEEPAFRSSNQNRVYPIPDKDAWPANFNETFWLEMSERCLGCRICAYVCPTCRCFDVRDEIISSKNGNTQIERIRSWDSCAGKSYRKIAGGHNSRAAKGDRMRNRFFCKFYYYSEQYGPTACTGCGRCIDACPVNIDITEVLQHLMEVPV
jgi:NAD-dependent dihydropyrimidine dehydrogenase PreA subunit